MQNLTFHLGLDIVGEGEEKKNLVSFINKLHLEDQISLLGFREDIPQLIA